MTEHTSNGMKLSLPDARAMVNGDISVDEYFAEVEKVIPAMFNKGANVAHQSKMNILKGNVDQGPHA